MFTLHHWICCSPSCPPKWADTLPAPGSLWWSRYLETKGAVSRARCYKQIDQLCSVFSRPLAKVWVSLPHALMRLSSGSEPLAAMKSHSSWCEKFWRKTKKQKKKETLLLEGDKCKQSHLLFSREYFVPGLGWTNGNLLFSGVKIVLLLDTCRREKATRIILEHLTCGVAVQYICKEK